LKDADTLLDPKIRSPARRQVIKQRPDFLRFDGNLPQDNRERAVSGR
jgi:hypothetical protein